MNYNDLVILAKQKNLSVTEFAKQIGMTRQGLQTATTNQTMAMDKIINVCRVLGITPNKFFGWEEDVQVIGNGIFASHVSGGNTQNSNEAILALKDELKEQRAIIKEKDKQINRLLTIIERNKFK